MFLRLAPIFHGLSESSGRLDYTDLVQLMLQYRTPVLRLEAFSAALCLFKALRRTVHRVRSNTSLLMPDPLTFVCATELPHMSQLHFRVSVIEGGRLRVHCTKHSYVTEVRDIELVEGVALINGVPDIDDVRHCFMVDDDVVVWSNSAGEHLSTSFSERGAFQAMLVYANYSNGKSVAVQTGRISLATPWWIHGIPRNALMKAL